MVLGKGGSLADWVSGQSLQGVNILLTGLAIQVVSLLAFLGTYRYFLRKLSHRRYILDDTYSPVYSSPRFKYFMICTPSPRLPSPCHGRLAET